MIFATNRHQGDLPIATDYKVWQGQFFKLRVAFACKLSMLYFGISSLFNWLFLVSDRSADFWTIVRDLVVLVLSASALLAIGIFKGKYRLNVIFIGLSSLLIFATNIETSAEGITLNNEFTGQVFLILAVFIPVKLGLHIVSQIGIVSIYYLVNYFANPHVGNTFISQAAVIIIELIDILELCLACDLAIFLQEKLKKSELKTRRELQLFVQKIAQELRQPLEVNLQKLGQALGRSEDLITITRSSLIKMLRRSDRQLALIQLMLDRARINKLQRGRTQTDYQLWRLQFVKRRLPWFLGIYAIFFVGLLLIGIYLILFEVESTEQFVSFLSYCFVSASLIVCVAVCYRLSKTRLISSHFNWLFVCTVFIICLGLQAYNLSTGYYKLSVNSEVFLLAAILFPVSWRMHLIAQISVVIIGYGAIVATLTARSLEIPMTSPEIFEEVFSFLIICFVCNMTVYSLERLRKAEYESRRQMQLFLYAIAHDLKTPVLGTSMFLENLLSEPQKTFEFTRSKVNRMLDSSARQLYLLDSLLEVHQSESQGITCKCQPVNPKYLVIDLTDGIKPILLKNEATLTNLIPDIPLVNADAIQLGRVYENLIINAIKHNPPGVNVLLTAKLQKNLLYCTVEDNGAGIDPAICDRIFALYGSESVRRTPGLGLGLYLCRQIIQAHGGKIGVNSSLGRGTTFWFTLPINIV